MKEADYTGAFLVIGGHVLVPIFALVMIFIMIRSIKRYGGDPYEEIRRDYREDNLFFNNLRYDIIYKIFRRNF